MVANEHELIEEVLGIFDALDDSGSEAEGGWGSQREMVTRDLEETISSPGEMVRGLRDAAQLVEGFCIAVEQSGMVPFVVMNDCRERVRRALELAERATAS